MIPSTYPIVSIIIPVYNLSDFLPYCLDSLLAQTFQEFEVLCIDDSSEDESIKIIEQYVLKDSRIHLLHQPHSGVSAARNIGIHHASGKYIIFIDGDDWVDPNMLKNMITNAIQYDCDMVICSTQVHFSKKCTLSFHVQNSFQQLLSVNDDLSNQCFFVHDSWALMEYPGIWPFIWNKLIRTELIKDNKIFFPNNLSLGEDGIFVHLLLQYANKISFLSDSLYHYRYLRNDSASVRQAQNITTRFYHHIEVVRVMFIEFSRRYLLEQQGENLLKWSIHFLYHDFVRLPVNRRKEIGYSLKYLFSEYPIDAISKKFNFILKRRLRNLTHIPTKYNGVIRFFNIFQSKVENRIIYLFIHNNKRKEKK